MRFADVEQAADDAKKNAIKNQIMTFSACFAEELHGAINEANGEVWGY